MLAALRRLLSHLLPPVCLLIGYPLLAATALGKPGTDPDQLESMRHHPLVQQAINDLARRESISPASIELLSFEEVVWPDTSLGCPQPGMRYRQVLQDGASILLRFSAGERVYHSGGSRPPFWCSSRKSGLRSGPPIGTELKGADSPGNLL